MRHPLSGLHLRPRVPEFDCVARGEPKVTQLELPTTNETSPTDLAYLVCVLFPQLQPALDLLVLANTGTLLQLR